jgi:deoxycytidine triphosphate deaminase
MVYSNTQILEELEKGHIICVPFTPKHVSHASLDVTLGHYYYRTERAHDHPVYNPFDQNDVKRYFGKPLHAMPHIEWCLQNGLTPLKGIPPELEP